MCVIDHLMTEEAVSKGGYSHFFSSRQRKIEQHLKSSHIKTYQNIDCKGSILRGVEIREHVK